MERYGRHADLSQGDACGARSPTACEGIVTTLARIPFVNAQAHTHALALALAGVSVADLAVLADIACRLARSPSPLVTYVESVAVSALAHAPTEPDRDALARCLQTQAGRGEVAHALADARRRIARGD